MSLSDNQIPGVHLPTKNFPGPNDVSHPVSTQPRNASGYWMKKPRPSCNCPPGLEYLTTMDQLIVHQKLELLEAITGFETNNKYVIRNISGQNVYYAIEDTDCCTRNCCGPLRPFDIKIYDNLKNEVIHLFRPLACQGCCFPCCMQSIEISSPPGTIIGTVEEEWQLIGWKFAIKNENQDIVLRINAPCCQLWCCIDVYFYITTPDGETEVGKITREFSGLGRALFTDADDFSITFPIDLDVKTKALLLGACFLIDFMFFERTGN